MLEKEEDGGAVGSVENPLKEKTETERKFLILDLGEIDFGGVEGAEIIQGYLVIEANGDELRVRQKGEKYFLTKKSGSGVTREEDESEIPREEFELLYSQTDGLRVEKTRYVIPYGNHNIEVDVFGGNLKGIITAEVEFGEGQDAVEFAPPQWLGQDVTESGVYSNQKLAQLARELESVSGVQVERQNVGAEFGLREGLSLLVEKISYDMDINNVTVTAIAGGSASGKTSKVAEELVKVYEGRALMLSMDDYSLGSEYVRRLVEFGEDINYDMPSYIDIDLLARHIAMLKKGIAVWTPVFDFKTGETSPKMRLVKPKPLVVVEGLFALDNRIVAQADTGVFVDISMHGRALRRLFRDVTRTSMVPNDILKYFAEVVDPMHEKYVQATKGQADLIIENEYNPNIESGNAGNKETQIKFQMTMAEADLLRMGAKLVGSFDQEDSYFEPVNKNLRERGESVRIRQENSRTFFTYKGPKENGEVRKRDRFDAEIDKVTADVFAKRYGKCVMELVKARRVYKLGNISVAIDSKILRMTEDGSESLPDHVEVCFDGNDIKDSDRMVLEELGLNMSDAVLESYQDLLRGTVEL